MTAKRPQSLHEALPSLWRILSRLWPYFRGSFLSILACMGALLLATALRLVEPWPLKIIFDRIIRVGHGRGDAGAFFLDFQALSNSTLLALAALAVLVVIGCRAMADYVVAVGFARSPTGASARSAPTCTAICLSCLFPFTTVLAAGTSPSG
jgi:ATP-binding cassette subfamily B protein